MNGIHAGHRERLRTRAAQEGLASFQPHEALELLLMQVIPQRDVNGLAHSLITAFGSLDAVLAAPEEDLRSQPGIGERAARWLRAVGDLTETYIALRPAPAPQVTNFSQAAAILGHHGRPGKEVWLLLCTDGPGRLLQTAALTPGPDGIPSVREAVQAALRCHATAVCSAHLPAIPGRPDAAEARFAYLLREAFTLIEIGYLDHIVFVDGKAVSVDRIGLSAEGEDGSALAAERPFAPDPRRKGRSGKK